MEQTCRPIKTAVVGVGMMGNSQIRNCLWKMLSPFFNGAIDL